MELFDINGKRPYVPRYGKIGGGMNFLKLFTAIFLDEKGGTLAITRVTANTLITASATNNRATEIEAVLNGAIESTNIADDAVTAAKISSDVVRTSYGLVQHTDGSLYVDVSDTTPALEITDGGLRVKVDNSSIERAAGGLNVKALGITNAMLAGSIDLTAKVTGTLPVGNGGTGATAAANAANGVVVLNASGLITSTMMTGLVNTTALKTTAGEVSSSSFPATIALPGGEFGFYPQVKLPLGDSTNAQIAYGSASAGYLTTISFTKTAGSATSYAQQRYVTASGDDMWIFLLIDKTTKEIIGAYQAPDHPAYGNGGDFDKLPHPFGSYDETKQEIVLLDKETCLALKQESKDTGESILTLVNEEYKPDMSKEEIYQPLHSGKFIDDGGNHIKQMVETIPDYIKVRTLVKLSQVEKNDKLQKQQTKQQQIEQEKIKKEQDILSAKNKLKALGLSDEEILALKN